MHACLRVSDYEWIYGIVINKRLNIFNTQLFIFYFQISVYLRSLCRDLLVSTGWYWYEEGAGARILLSGNFTCKF